MSRILKFEQCPLSALALRINEGHYSGRRAIRQGLEHCRQVGLMLIQAKQRIGHGNWYPWIKENLAFGAPQAWKYMKLARSKSCLKQDSTIDEAIEETRRPNRSKTTGLDEWFTPPRIVRAVKDVMGGIDTDPASCPVAQKIVKAAVYYSEDDNGLDHKWTGRVFLNPPYRWPAVQQFAEKLGEHWRAKQISEAIVLVNNATDTNWFQRLAKLSSAICFVKGRLKYYTSEGQPHEATSLQGQAVLYFGQHANAFANKFTGFGIVMSTVSQQCPGGDRKGISPPS